MKTQRVCDRIEVTEVGSGVVEVALSRPEKMNALDPAMFDGLVEAAKWVRTIKGLRAVVLHGQGKAFCAGLDMGSFAAMADGQGANMGNLLPREGSIANRAQQTAWAWRNLPVPVIAAVQGVAFGGGLQVAMGADVRFTDAHSKWSVLEIKWGLVPDMAGMPLLRELVRGDVLRDLTYTGRVVLGQEAQALGLATHVVEDPLAAARAMAAQIAGRSPHAVQAGKRLLNALADSSAAELLLAETTEQVALIGSPNQVEAIRAGVAQRTPQFQEVS